MNQFDGIERLTEDQERKIWAEWIEPIVKKYYEGAIEYKFFEEPESINQDDFKRFWKYNLASFIYKIKPPGVLNTMTDEEWFVWVCDNPLEPLSLISDILVTLKSGMNDRLVKPFFNILKRIVYNGYLPIFLAYIGQESGDGILTTDSEVKRKLRPDQEDKQSCQEIAKRVWNDQHILDIKHMMNHPEILKIVGKRYKEDTLRGWLSEIAPERAKKPGRRPPEVRKEQDKICKEIGISI